MMLLVPMYFQVSAHATLTNAGAHLMPSVIGNAVGGLLAGYIIKRFIRFNTERSILTIPTELGDIS
jgi:formate/nitrite transporter FocA (FNT family)